MAAIVFHPVALPPAPGPGRRSPPRSCLGSCRGSPPSPDHPPLLDPASVITHRRFLRPDELHNRSSAAALTSSFCRQRLRNHCSASVAIVALRPQIPQSGLCFAPGLLVIWPDALSAPQEFLADHRPILTAQFIAIGEGAFTLQAAHHRLLAPFGIPKHSLAIRAVVRVFAGPGRAGGVRGCARARDTLTSPIGSWAPLAASQARQQHPPSQQGPASESFQRLRRLVHGDQIPAVIVSASAAVCLKEPASPMVLPSRADAWIPLFAGVRRWSVAASLFQPIRQSIWHSQSLQ